MCVLIIWEGSGSTSFQRNQLPLSEKIESIDEEADERAKASVAISHNNTIASDEKIEGMHRTIVAGRGRAVIWTMASTDILFFALLKLAFLTMD